MARASASGETPAAGSDPADTGHILQPVPVAGSRRPIAVAVAICVVLAVLVWQPWNTGGAFPARLSSPSALAVAPPTAVLSEPVPTRPASPGPTMRGPRPSFGPAPVVVPVSVAYVSLGDNEWSVVALLAPYRLGAPDQPWVPDVPGATQPPGGPLLVLQLGPNHASRPIEPADDPGAVCRVRDGFRDYAAAHLPADRVAYLGVTFPGMDPRARVSVVVLDRRGVALTRLSAVTVRLSGMTEGRRYTIPTTGPGGAALFALSPRAILPVAAYRFDIATPGVPGHRYLYACIGP